MAEFGEDDDHDQFGRYTPNAEGEDSLNEDLLKRLARVVRGRGALSCAKVSRVCKFAGSPRLPVDLSRSETVPRAIKRPAVIVGILLVGAAAVWGRGRVPHRAAKSVAVVAESRAGKTLSASLRLADSVVDQAASASMTFGGHKLIRSADLRLQVPDVALTAHRVDSVARAYSGFVAESHIDEVEQAATDARVVIHVPADRFDTTLAGLRHLGHVRNESVGTGDVTREYSDIETRVTVTEETARRLRVLLSDRPGKLADILLVERELTRVATELEQLKGQRRMYDGQVAMSSIAVTLFTPTPVPAAPTALTTFRASLSESMERLTGVLVSSVASVVDMIAFVIPWAIVAGLGWWCIRVLRRAY